MTLALMDVAVAETLKCSHCLRPLKELGFVYSGRRIVPRQVAQLKGFMIRGTLDGLQYGCLECQEAVFVPAGDRWPKAVVAQEADLREPYQESGPTSEFLRRSRPSGVARAEDSQDLIRSGDT